MAPAVTGILETALYVADLERSEEFYGRVFGFVTIDRQGSRMRALAVGYRQVLLLFKAGAAAAGAQTPEGLIPGHDGRGRLHLAFSIEAGQLHVWEQRLRELNIAVESRVKWPRGGTSLYFRDPDGHALELVTPGCWTVY